MPLERDGMTVMKTDDFTNFTDQAFRQTPFASDWLHLDNSGSSLLSSSVMESIQRYQSLEWQFGGYVAQERSRYIFETVYEKLSFLFGGQGSGYAITGSAVDAWTKCFYSLPFEKGDVILTSHNEYCSNYAAYLHRAERDGIQIRVADSADDGTVDIKSFQALFDDKVKLVSVTHIPSSSGQIMPVKKIAAMSKGSQALFLLDASQSVGHVPLNVEDIGCDMMSATSRKFLRGPRGVGFLFANEAAREKMSPLIVTNNSGQWTATNSFTYRKDARFFEIWEKSYTALAGFVSALDNLIALKPERVFECLMERAAALRSRLADMPGIHITCPPDAKGAIIGFQKHGLSSAFVKRTLEASKIGVQIGTVLHTRLDLEKRGIHELIRVSPHIYTRDQDIEIFCQAVNRI